MYCPVTQAHVSKSHAHDPSILKLFLTKLQKYEADVSGIPDSVMYSCAAAWMASIRVCCSELVLKFLKNLKNKGPSQNCFFPSMTHCILAFLYTEYIQYTLGECS